MVISYGQPNIPIYFGPNYNKIDMSKFKITENRKVEVIGRVNNETYIDTIGGRADVNTSHDGLNLYQLKKIDN